MISKKGYYKGELYNSQLEAQWAVVFDSLGINYTHRTEIMRPYIGPPYKPDFYLPDFNIHVEVKGFNSYFDECKEKMTASMVGYRPLINRLLILGSIPRQSHDHDMTNEAPSFSLVEASRNKTGILEHKLAYFYKIEGFTTIGIVETGRIGFEQFPPGADLSCKWIKTNEWSMVSRYDKGKIAAAFCDGFSFRLDEHHVLIPEKRNDSDDFDEGLPF